MNIIQLTPGTGTYYCGSCLRDSTLAKALCEAGHRVTVVPLYLPLVNEHQGTLDVCPVQMGCISFYLRDRFPLFREAPGWFDHLLGNDATLTMASRIARTTNAAELGEMTVSMLDAMDGAQAAGIRNLLRYLSSMDRPDIICLANAMLAGLAAPIRQALDAPVVAVLQGEDRFLDGLPEPFRERAWTLLSRQIRHVDALIAVSRYYRDVMNRRLSLSGIASQVVYSGIALDGFPVESSAPASPAVGYLSRLSRENGLENLIEAFTILRDEVSIPELRLIIAGDVAPADRLFVNRLIRKLKATDLWTDIEFHRHISRDEKIRLLQRMSIVSVPVIHDESFGLYILEALAAGVPVVAPPRGAIPELLEATGGGILFEPNDPGVLAETIGQLLGDPARRRQLAHRGRVVVHQDFSATKMAENMVNVFQQIIGER